AVLCSDLLGAVIEDLLLGDLGGIARSPIDLDEVGGTDRSWIRRRAHDDPSGHCVGRVFQHEAREIALDSLCRGIIDRADDRTIARRGNLWSGIDHAFQHRIDTVTCRAVDLRWDVQSIYVLADQTTF